MFRQYIKCFASTLFLRGFFANGGKKAKNRKEQKQKKLESQKKIVSHGSNYIIYT